MSETNVRFSGRPTDPDVRMLLEAIPTESLKPGTLVPYQQIADVLKEKVSSYRFKTVIGAWRKRLYKDDEIIFEAVPNEGYVVLDDSGKINHASKKLVNGHRRIRKAADVAQRTPEENLTDDEKRNRNFTILTGGAMTTLYHTERKKLAYKVVSVTDSKKDQAQQGRV